MGFPHAVYYETDKLHRTSLYCHVLWYCKTGVVGISSSVPAFFMFPLQQFWHFPLDLAKNVSPCFHSRHRWSTSVTELRSIKPSLSSLLNFMHHRFHIPFKILISHSFILRNIREGFHYAKVNTVERTKHTGSICFQEIYFQEVCIILACN